MKYQYFYQTKTNENRDGWITAKNRAEAYAALRKQGIRPYRVVGDDPVRWQPWAIGALVAALTVALAAVLLFRTASAADGLPARRCQIIGEAETVRAGVADGWAAVFPLKLDRHLALYAQPGWAVEHRDLTDEEVAGFAADLAEPACAVLPGDGPEVRQLKGIVAAMRGELAARIAEGGTVRDYLEFLDWRQEDEIAYQRQAREQLLRTPDSLREKALVNTNIRLREMGLPEIGE